MTGRIRQGMGVLAIAIGAGVLWLLFNSSADESEIAESMATLTGAAFVVCALVGLYYVAQGLMGGDKEAD
jgi:hypothetical protein